MKNLLLDAVIITAVTCSLYALTARQEYEKGFADGVQSAPKPTPQPALSLLQKDQVCSAWLFNTNIKESKKRICGGRG